MQPKISTNGLTDIKKIHQQNLLVEGREDLAIFDIGAVMGVTDVVVVVSPLSVLDVEWTLLGVANEVAIVVVVRLAEFVEFVLWSYCKKKIHIT